MKQTPFTALRKFVREPSRKGRGVEQCELCSMVLAPDHRHLLEVEPQRVICACAPCALRFQNVVGGRFKLIPRDTFVLPDFRMTEAQWDSLALPINLAFFFYSTPGEKVVARYPSPAGVTASLLSLDAWDILVEDNPALADLEPDVEALLVNRVKGTQGYFRAPIDTCYELAGLVRLHWRGLSGGDAVWNEIDRFFTHLQKTARALKPASRSAIQNPHSAIEWPGFSERKKASSPTAVRRMRRRRVSGPSAPNVPRS